MLYTSQSSSKLLPPKGSIYSLNTSQSSSVSMNNMLPPKFNRSISSSMSSSIYNEDSINSSHYNSINSSNNVNEISREQKVVRNFSKNKNTHNNNLSNLVSLSFQNSHNNSMASSLSSSLQKYQQKSLSHTDNDLRFQHFKSLTSLNKKIPKDDIQGRVRQLQQKLKKNQQCLKYYTDEVNNLKSNYIKIDSIKNLQQTFLTQKQLNNNNINQQQNKQNSCVSNNTLNDQNIQKRFKQIDLLKKQVKKLMQKQDSTRNDFKLFQMSIVNGMTNFKQFLSQSIDQISKRQNKNKKKMFQKLDQQINKKIKQLNDNQPKSNLQFNINIKKSQQKFLKDPILIKIKQELSAVIINKSITDKFNSYKDLIVFNNSKTNLINTNSNSQVLKNDSNVQKQKYSIQQTQIIYFIDQDGYLLDKQGFYLLNNQEKIKLNDMQIQLLKQNQVLNQIQKII